ncbi:hypothetical protein CHINAEXTREME_16320 [Halobiforma lacisalsi AJ5]|uniref:Uncharacterized protein n=1 Tax=Natronobacterium lacisalsi AJ5 TaxID=358396 RepID=M0LCG0_NATLA|nr:hypothetical protein [Halobiforma lacisalsi]APW99239.1 hypothetical protein CHINAEXTREME_16320 [Halobiforma lacisalsi AJ5]EMA30808.1 hypothetical protein C445_15916 [Halobiforma lacisalsi AJ5]
MVTLRRHLTTERPRLALAVVAAVGATTTTVLVPLGLLGIGTSGRPGIVGFRVAFGLIPAVAGAICGLYRLGLPAAVACGLAPGGTFYLVVVVGAALEVGTVGGGDAPLGPLSVVLTAPSFVLALVGFVAGLAVAAVRG